MRRIDTFPVFLALAVIAALVPPPSLAQPDTWMPDRVIVRFHEGAVVSRMGTARIPLEEVAAGRADLVPELSGLGIRHVQKLFPDFEHASIHTMTVRGEPVDLPEDLTDIYVLHIPGRDVQETVQALGRLPFVVYAEPDLVRTVSFLPNDTYFGNQWWLRNIGQFGGASDEDVDGDLAWNTHTGGSNPIRVGIVDSGIDLAHPDLGAIEQGPDFITPGTPPEDDATNSHGTAVAGIVGARGNNGIGVAGVNWGASLVAIKACDSGGSCPVSATTGGVEWARTGGIPIVNLSFGGYGSSETERVVYRNAHAAGMLCVAAMGNDNTDLPAYPANYTKFVYAVGALYNNGDRWQDAAITGCSFGTYYGSNIGGGIDISAPGGRSIATTKRVVQGSYYIVPSQCEDGFGGTSAAAPVVAGVGSLLLSYRPSLSGEDIAEVLNRTAEDRTQYGVGWDDKSGFGRVNANDALQFVTAGRLVQQGIQSSVVDVGHVDMNMTLFGVPGLASGTYPTRRHEIHSTVTFAQPFVGTPDAWAKTFGSVGWSAVNPREHGKEPVGWASVIGGTVTPTSMQLKTFVFEVFSNQGAPLGWYPASPSDARMAWTSVGRVWEAPDVSQSFFVPQVGPTSTPTEGQSAIALLRACPNNDGGTSLPNSARVKVVLRSEGGTGIAGVQPQDIYVLFNGGTTAQGFYGTGADSVIANSTWNQNPLCPDVRVLTADAPTDASGVTYITFTGSTPGSPGVGTRDPNRKWGHYDSKLPVYALGTELQGRLTSDPGSDPYVLRVKNFDVSGGLAAVMNQGEAVTTVDLNTVVANMNNPGVTAY